MSREVRFQILVKENFERALSAGRNALNGFVGFAGGIARRIRGIFNLRNLLLTGGAGLAVKEVLSRAFGVETMEAQFKVLLGSAAAARKRIKELQDFSASTPFQLDDIAKASRQLHVFTEGAMGSAASLREIGDAAASVNQGIGDVSFWVGRAYSAIKGGQPFGEAAMRLQEMGIMTPKVRQEMERLQKAGAGSGQVFAVLQARLKEFDGGMEALSKTGGGLVSTLKDNWNLALADFGKAFLSLSKDAISGLIRRIQTLREDGTIERWAQRGAKAARVLADTLGDVFSSDQKTRSRALADMGQVVVAMFTDAGSAFMNVVEPRFLGLLNRLTTKGAAQHEVEKAGGRLSQSDNVLSRLIGIVVKRGAGGMQSDLRFDESDPKHKTDRTATALGSILARRDQAPDATAAEEAAKKFGRTLGVWIKDPDLMRNLAEKAGVAGFLPKQAQKTENAAAVMGNELSLAEVFTRMQGVDRPDALGTEMRPMIVSVKEMQGGEA